MRMRRPGPSNRNAMTLVELLVAIVIIGVLVGLLLQAVQAVRESSRRTVCSNNIKEIGLATANYEQARRVLPPGAYSTWGITWWHALLPYLEANDVFSLYDPRYGYIVSSTSPKVTNLQVIEARVPNMTCPSDTGPLAYSTTVRSKYNYVANAGNVGLTWAPVAGAAYTSRLASRVRSGTTVLNGGEPFLFTGTSNGTGTGNGAGMLPGYTSGKTPEQVSLRKITDGLSKTMGFSELLRTANALDMRGLAWHSNVTFFSAWNVPNSGTKDVLAVGGGCEEKSTCTNGSQGQPADQAARSLHGGGVMVCLLDGSTRFVVNNVDWNVWQAASTTQGAEASSLE